MAEVCVVVPNYNGIEYLKTCLDALLKQKMEAFPIIIVDNGSSDGSVEYVTEHYPMLHLIALPENTGFCHAVNVGIRASKTPYVILLNNDTEVDENFVSELLAGIKKDEAIFSCAAKMIQYHNREKIDDAGDFYSALGWAFARGKGKPVSKYDTDRQIFSSCAGAAIYRRSILKEIGLFDELHYAYLEDMDIGYRARIHGYKNVYTPKAKVYHMGSGTSGSRYNDFKIRFSSRNNVYLIYKNMPFLQMLFNLPLIVLGFLIKLLFFAAKGYGREYAAGIKNGFTLSFEGKLLGKKVRFQTKHLANYLKIEGELLVNIFRRFL